MHFYRLVLIFFCVVTRVEATVLWQSLPKSPCAALLSDTFEIPSEELLNSRISDIESFWQEYFAIKGWPFQEVRVRLYSGTIRTETTNVEISRNNGPVYDRVTGILYLDPAFFLTFADKVGPASDAFVVLILSHEIGHHIQWLRATYDRAINHVLQTVGNIPLIFDGYVHPTLEKQADCLSGMLFGNFWRKGLVTLPQLNEMRTRIALMGGDLQAQIAISKGENPMGRYIYPSGTDRLKWFNIGFNASDISACEPFQVPVLN